MIEIIDFTKYPLTPRKYGGKNGRKIGIFYKDEPYLLKFSIRNDKNKEEYSKSCISEYLGCHIFDLCDIEVQHTLLGTYENKLVVACKDFKSDDEDFYDFASIKNSVIESDENGYGTNLDDILFSIDKLDIFPPKEVKKRFWDMFIVDTFIGNFDRHNGNWGFIYSRIDKEYRLAPVFDCGSCLFPKIFKSEVKNIINNQEEINKRIYLFPRSVIKNYSTEDKNPKINPYNFLLNTDNVDCLRSLQDITDRINLDKIKDIVCQLPIENELKKFLELILNKRKELILDYVLKNNPNLYLIYSSITKNREI